MMRPEIFRSSGPQAQDAQQHGTGQPEDLGGEAARSTLTVHAVQCAVHHWIHGARDRVVESPGGRWWQRPRPRRPPRVPHRDVVVQTGQHCSTEAGLPSGWCWYISPVRH
jgi:hypothetical protein